MTVHVTLMTGKGEEKQGKVMSESIGMGILDSACTKTVAGAIWMQEFVATLTEVDRRAVEKSARNSRSLYRFGDGVESKSTKAVNIPIHIGSKKKIIEVDVVDNDIPLLISKPTMKFIGMTLDFVKDEAIIDGEILKLTCNSSGHYTVPICYGVKQNCHVVFHLENLSKLPVDEKKRKALKRAQAILSCI